MFEEKFEQWWDKNKNVSECNCQTCKETARTIWMAGKDQGFSVGFDKGREMGRGEGYKEAMRGNND